MNKITRKEYEILYSLLDKNLLYLNKIIRSPKMNVDFYDFVDAFRERDKLKQKILNILDDILFDNKVK